MYFDSLSPLGSTPEDIEAWSIIGRATAAETLPPPTVAEQLATAEAALEEGYKLCWATTNSLTAAIARRIVNRRETKVTGLRQQLAEVGNLAIPSPREAVELPVVIPDQYAPPVLP